MRKLIIISCALLATIYASAQEENYNNWNFMYGRSGTPGDIFRIGMEVGRGNKGAIYVEGGYEFSRKYDLKYQSYGLMGAYRYYILGDNVMSSMAKINLIAGAGAVIQYEHEPTVYKGTKFLQRMNYGGSGHLVAEYFFDPVVGFYVMAEQRLYLKKNLGTKNYFLGLGLRIHF